MLLSYISPIMFIFPRDLKNCTSALAASNNEIISTLRFGAHWQLHARAENATARAISTSWRSSPTLSPQTGSVVERPRSSRS